MTGTREGFMGCPFCGATDIEIESEDNFNMMRDKSEDKKICICVRCWNCSLDLYDHTYDVTDYKERLEILRKKWNRRAYEF